MSTAFITPSYLPDLERCRLLVESIDRYASKDFRHYVIVDRQDRKAFSSLASSRTEIVIKQDVVSGLHQLRLAPKWWLKGLGAPVRGWIVQQIIKLSVDRLGEATSFVFLDSDAFLLRPFDPAWTHADGPVPLFREQGPELLSDMNTVWHEACAERLGIELRPPFDVNYVGALVTWRRDTLGRLHDRLEQVNGRSWVDAIVRMRRLSEYTLYGVFVDHVVGPGPAGHVQDASIPTLNHWATTPKTRADIVSWLGTLGDAQVGGMISAKSGTDIADVRAALRETGYL